MINKNNGNCVVDSCKCQKEDENVFKPLKNGFNGGRRFYISESDMTEFIDENIDLLRHRLPNCDLDELEVLELLEKDIKVYKFDQDRNINPGFSIEKIDEKLMRFDLVGNEIVSVETNAEEAIKIYLLAGSYERIFYMGLMPQTRDLIKKDPVINYLAYQSPAFYLDLLCGGEL